MPLAAGLAVAAGVLLCIVPTAGRKEPLPTPPPAGLAHPDKPPVREVIDNTVGLGVCAADVAARPADTAQSADTPRVDDRAPLGQKVKDNNKRSN